MDAAQVKQILTKVDHTLLRVDSRWEEIQEVLDDAMRYETASACIPPSFVERAEAYVDGRLPICTVIGFPNGYATTATKCFEASDAVAKGASEIDMVVNVGWVKEGRFDDILDEIVPGKTLKGHHRDLPFDRPGDHFHVSGGVQVQGRIYQDLYRLFKSRSNKRSCISDGIACNRWHTGQGGRWYRILGGCSRFYCTGSKQTWYQPRGSGGQRRES